MCESLKYCKHFHESIIVLALRGSLCLHPGSGLCTHARVYIQQFPCSRFVDIANLKEAWCGQSRYLIVRLVCGVNIGIQKMKQPKWFCWQRHRSSLANSGEDVKDAVSHIATTRCHCFCLETSNDDKLELQKCKLWKCSERTTLTDESRNAVHNCSCPCYCCSLTLSVICP